MYGYVRGTLDQVVSIVKAQEHINVLGGHIGAHVILEEPWTQWIQIRRPGISRRIHLKVGPNWRSIIGDPAGKKRCKDVHVVIPHAVRVESLRLHPCAVDETAGSV